MHQNHMEKLWKPGSLGPILKGSDSVGVKQGPRSNKFPGDANCWLEAHILKLADLEYHQGILSRVLGYHSLSKHKIKGSFARL